VKSVKHVFETSVGTVEVRLDHESRTIGAYRFDDQHHAAAAAIENWDYVELTDVFSRQIGVPLQEASGIAAAVQEQISTASLSERLSGTRRADTGASMRLALEKAGMLRRWAAVVLDTFIVLIPLEIVVALTRGGGFAGLGLYFFFALTYYALSEALTGATIGKGIVRIRVVDEAGEHLSLEAAVLRNLLRPVDALCGYLVGGVLALRSPLGQRLGDRVAHTVVVRR
jgi:uncharacterized RDD family membrane protein YckC